MRNAKAFCSIPILSAVLLSVKLSGQAVSTGEPARFYEVEGIRIPVHVVTVKEEGAEKPSEKER